MLGLADNQLLVVFAVCGAICAAIVRHKGYPSQECFRYFMWGGLLFPVALVFAILKKPDELGLVARGGVRKCPDCAELIRVEARVCRFCGRDLDESTGL